jgi:hypothetical protein
MLVALFTGNEYDEIYPPAATRFTKVKAPAEWIVRIDALIGFYAKAA